MIALSSAAVRNLPRTSSAASCPVFDLAPFLRLHPGPKASRRLPVPPRRRRLARKEARGCATWWCPEYHPKRIPRIQCTPRDNPKSILI